MKLRWLKVIGLALFAAILAALFVSGLWRAFVGPKARAVTSRSFESTPARLERGKYLVENVTGCLHCHSDRDWKGNGSPIEARKGAGAFFYGAPGTLHAPNITPDKETGIGAWTKEQFRDAVRFNKNPRGGLLNYPMFPHVTLTDAETDAIWAFLQTVPPLRNPVQRYVAK